MYVIFDADGEAWTLKDGRLFMVSSEEIGEENGYPCADWEQAVQMLNKMGYMNGFDD